MSQASLGSVSVEGTPVPSGLRPTAEPEDKGDLLGGAKPSLGLDRLFLLVLSGLAAWGVVYVLTHAIEDAPGLLAIFASGVMVPLMGIALLRPWVLEAYEHGLLAKARRRRWIPWARIVSVRVTENSSSRLQSPRVVWTLDDGSEIDANSTFYRQPLHELVALTFVRVVQARVQQANLFDLPFEACLERAKAIGVEVIGEELTDKHFDTLRRHVRERYAPVPKATAKARGTSVPQPSGTES